MEPGVGMVGTPGAGPNRPRLSGAIGVGDDLLGVHEAAKVSLT